MFNDTKLGIIRHKGSVWTAYVGNRKLEDSKSKKEALKRILEEIDIQWKAFLGKVQARGNYRRENYYYHRVGRRISRSKRRLFGI